MLVRLPFSVALVASRAVRSPVPRTGTKRGMSASTNYQAWRVVQQDDGSFRGAEQTLSTADLPHAEDGVLVRVTHSSLNYKDALSATGNRGVTRTFPHTPGIDAAGTIVGEGEGEGEGEGGAPALVTGYDLGMNTDGGFGEYIRVPRGWIVSPPPPAFEANPRAAMVYGTAGLTAGLCVRKLMLMGADPSRGRRVVVTGATGAVGTVAVELLGRLGFEVVAVSGKASHESHRDRLLELGAKEVLGRDALEESKKPLVRPTFDHAVDTVGGRPLAELLKRIKPGGSVACCGLVAGAGLDTTVLPFILRGVNLLGVDSVEIPLSEKEEVWEKLAGEWACPKTEALAASIGRHQLEESLGKILKGESSGKIVLDHDLTEK